MNKFISTIVMYFVFTSISFAQQTDLPRVVGHRGFSAAAPENSMASIEKCIQCKANGCETDVRATQDGVLVLFHDDNLKRLIRNITPEQKSKTIADFDFKTVKTFDCNGTQIPAFSEYLKALKNTGCRPVIEIKVPQIEKAVIDQIRANKMESQVVIIAFDVNVVKNCRTIAPEIQSAWLCVRKGKESETDFSERVIKTLAECGTNIVDMAEAGLSEGVFKQLKAAGIRIMVWTCDKPQRMKVLFDMGVESVTTNKPDAALSVLGQL